jgi:hypothetical protein
VKHLPNGTSLQVLIAIISVSESSKIVLDFVVDSSLGRKSFIQVDLLTGIDLKSLTLYHVLVDNHFLAVSLLNGKSAMLDFNI